LEGSKRKASAPLLIRQQIQIF